MQYLHAVRTACALFIIDTISTILYTYIMHTILYMLYSIYWLHVLNMLHVPWILYIPKYMLNICIACALPICYTNYLLYISFIYDILSTISYLLSTIY